MSNPCPIKRARRIELRRKGHGYAERCFYCAEDDVFCFEQDHPVTEQLDASFERTVCRNCHRKLEATRDIKKLTKNGLRNIHESDREQLQRYLLLLAEDQDSIAELLESPTVSVALTAATLRETGASLRRKAQLQPLLIYTPTSGNSSEWEGLGCA